MTETPDVEHTQKRGASSSEGQHGLPVSSPLTLQEPNSVPGVVTRDIEEMPTVFLPSNRKLIETSDEEQTQKLGAFSKGPHGLPVPSPLTLQELDLVAAVTTGDIEQTPTTILPSNGNLTEIPDIEQTHKRGAISQSLNGLPVSSPLQELDLVAAVTTGDIEQTPTAILPSNGNLTEIPDEEQTQKRGAITQSLNGLPVSSPLQELDLTTAVVAQNLKVPSTPKPILTSPVIASQRKVKKRARRDPWLFATILVACVAGVSSVWYFFQHHVLLTYLDSYSHLLIARRVFDNLTPGFAQLGGVWLPLPDILMLPFVWNDYLWHTGLAGSLVGLPCYIVASIYLFLAARRITGSSRASFVGSLLFILNPNVLYLQTTPLTEIVLAATMAMTFYHFLAWVQDENPRQLVLTAFGTFLATLSRYDGWFLFVILLIAIVLVSFLKRHTKHQMEGNLLAFSILSGLGIVLWILWCALIFGDPLFFQRGPFSSQVQQSVLLNAHTLFTYHNVLFSLQTFGIDAIANVGLVTFIIGMIGVVTFIMKRRFSAETIAGLVFLFPFAFYVFSLFTGQAALYIPDVMPPNSPDYLLSIPHA